MANKILKIGSRMAAALLCAVSALTFSTHGEAQLRYGFRFAGDIAKAKLSTPAAGAGQSDAMGYLSSDAKLVNRSGFSGGLVLEYQFEKCGFAPEIAVLYTRYNTRLQVHDRTPHSFGRNFIEVPLHLKWKFWIPQTKNLFAPMVYTGPSLMFRLDHKSGLGYPSDHGSAEAREGGNPYTFKSKVVQPGWDVGIGFDVVNFIQITAGYRFGLGNALDSPEGMKLRTNGWNVAATLLFDF